MIAVYVLPLADVTTACDVIHSITAELQSHYDIFGDVNHVTLSSTMTNFTQFVDCPTRDNKTLDLLYANIKNTYSSTALPSFSNSDHNLVYLSPQYKPLGQQQPANTTTVLKYPKKKTLDY